MFLVVTDKASELRQPFSIALEQRVHVKTIAIWLLLNDPALGSELTLTIRHSNDSIVHQEVVTVADIKTNLGATQDYTHGKYIWEPSTAVRIGRGDYFFCVEQTQGYTFSNFVGWCRDWESPYFASNSLGDYEDPFYLRIYDHEGRQLAA
jgi:hypothetical protein